MLLELRAKNCFIFGHEIDFSLQAQKLIRKFPDHLFTSHASQPRVLKSAGLFGQNNTGKTCLIKCLRVVKSVLEKTELGTISNFFTQSTICELSVRFVEEGRYFEYQFGIDARDERFVYEQFCEHIYEKGSREPQERVFFQRDRQQGIYRCENEAHAALMPILSADNILIYLLDTQQGDVLHEAKRILTQFAARIDIVDMNNIPLSRTIEILKNENALCDKVVNFIRNADLYLDDISFLHDKDIEQQKLIYPEDIHMPAEKVLHIPEQLSLVSVYKGVAVPSLLFDSTGTKKIAALASYIIEALSEGRILVVDEIDSSIHFKLTRAIVALFNNELNASAQLIFTAHDINLIDCRRLLRQDQVWFIHKDEEGIYVYSLSDFSAEEGVTPQCNLMEIYKKGVLGALPDPQFINSLLELTGQSSPCPTPQS